MTKKLVKRGITELVTPGVSINDNVLNYKENNLSLIHISEAAESVVNLLADCVLTKPHVFKLVIVRCP